MVVEADRVGIKPKVRLPAVYLGDLGGGRSWDSVGRAQKAR